MFLRRKKREDYAVIPKREPYHVIGKRLSPLGIPRDGDLIIFAPGTSRDPVSIGLWQNFQLSREPELFDFLCFDLGKKIAVFQVQPIEGWGKYGKLRFIKFEKIEKLAGTEWSPRGRILRPSLD
ncbi:MAG: hypothetical protein UW68_C0024G0004 [Candidatus Collierbacteria bacterium GW2011_GWB1_44_6]|uniref:Uncharacterized protein n=2 Tax=Candidatus Collieribacteriota TaxID=1752725 RepID=A0A0G1JML6_9BACT|nr:MAG: hypothetical protein UV68_C0030G0007 [Candidatus Collierbacteria bacterium GW2011_GWC2_43_12]KKT72806.1 MAG: hypothetical protein UW68_C0024G0004 [Candidatus Collierbacteria bacterium GW2011_GWB1_44_6]KKT83805.1 MAG: hypothetical protein UW80_C0006G0009 [Microgenomates group bacterium GW2011_GWC1_44_9]